jgi:predicted acyl esterase
MKTPPLGCAVLFAAFLAIIALAAFAQTPPPAPSLPAKESAPTAADYHLRWGVKIPMRDKVELNATLYLPTTKDEAPSKTPVIFTLTPYISDAYHSRGQRTLDN